MRIYTEIVSRRPAQTLYAEEVPGSAEELVVRRFGYEYTVRTVLRQVHSSRNGGVVRDIVVGHSSGHVSPQVDLLYAIDSALQGPGAPTGRLVREGV